MANSGLPWRELISRRRALTLAPGIAGGLCVASTPLAAMRSLSRDDDDDDHDRDHDHEHDLPVADIQDVLQSEGTVMDGVLTVEQDRDDLAVIGPDGIPFKPSWEINNQLYFQPIRGKKAIFNGDICVLPSESNYVIDEIIENGLVFMAFHQHFFELSPQVFFIHFRGIGNPVELAEGVANVVRATGTPLPQSLPSHPTTPLDPNRLADILGGTAEVGSDGVVTVSVARKETIVLAGVPLKPETGVSHTIAFEPLDGDAHVAAAPDFALIASEITPVASVMRRHGFVIHCLYNQETAEHPQLYFSHQLAIGNAYDLARKIRDGLNRTNSAFKP